MSADRELIQGSLPPEALSILMELKEEVAALKSQISLMGKQVYTHKEAEQILGMTAPTLRKLRYEGQIGYVQSDSKILFTQQDIDKFLQSHHHEAYA